MPNFYFKFFLIHLLFTLFLIFPFTNSFAQDVDITAGKSLFNANCAACHKLDKKMTGPALRHAENRLLNDEGLDKQWLYAWIRNSSAVIKSGDSYANKIYAEYNRSAMTAYPQLSDVDIENILAYTAQEKPIPIATAVVSTAVASSNDLGLSNEIILGIFSVLFFLLATGLLLVSNTLRNFARLNDVKLIEKEKSKPIWKAFVDNQFLMLCSAILFFLVSAYGFYGWAMQIGTNQGYMPVQPIHYSHKIHAGDNQIDCNYCHSSARVSKHSGIPSLNVCMNCHKTIFEYKEKLLKNIQKHFMMVKYKNFIKL